MEESMMVTSIEKKARVLGLRMTEQRRIVARVLSGSENHPDIEELHRQAVKCDSRISISTIYRTVRLFEDAGIITRLDFRDGKSRYEVSRESHHDHLIDVKTGKVMEFRDPEIERLQEKVAKRLGYRLVDHCFELYGIALENK